MTPARRRTRLALPAGTARLGTTSPGFLAAGVDVVGAVLGALAPQPT